MTCDDKSSKRLDISDRPILYETSLTTVADIAAKMALLAGGVYLTQKWRNSHDDDGSELPRDGNDIQSDVDKILKVITKLKYEQESHSSRREDINEFMDRSNSVNIN